MAKLTEKTRAVFEYVRDFDGGNGVTFEDIAAATGLGTKSIGPIVWMSLNTKKDKQGNILREALVSYEKRTIKGEDKPVGYVHITEAGKVYEDPEEEVAE